MPIKLQDSYLDLINLLLLEILVNNFELSSFKKEKDAEIIHLYFKEIYRISSEYRIEKIRSKGFFPEVIIQDFPIRGHKVYLHIGCRRLLNEVIGKVVIEIGTYYQKASDNRRVFVFFKIDR